ncbi:MAG: carbamoyl-phosphate synthase small subunit [Rhodospirillales bacterium]|nr:carbamoyl-phosphate synthase small subunit [Alphaproteobacteria bacterium]MCB9986831.1 carbamoyl-phosphate synthase small subunit [Rhodospirillales bacterium]USO08405.1 MAG: carbamoyl-phosphate synthase small subunit [Rhodospirillales bacterium]
MTKTALLAGSGFSALPILAALRRAGWRVVVAGNRPDDPCHLYADASAHIDYADPDALLATAREHAADALVPGCNDESYLAAADVAAILNISGLDTPEIARTIHEKSRYRALMLAHGFPVPRAVAGDDPAGLSPPYLVKPVDSSTGRGMTRIDDPACLPVALEIARAASRTGNALIEEFFTGSLHSHSAFLENGTILWDVFADEYCTVYPYAVNCSNCPSGLPDAPRETMRREMTRLAAALKLANGLLHTQFMWNGHEMRIIESMRRCPGDLYGEMIAQSTGCDYAARYIAPFIGARQPQAAPAPERCIGRHTITFAKPVTACEIRLDLPGTHNLRYVPLAVSGARIDPAPHGKLGLFFVEFPDRTRMLEFAPKFADHVTLENPEGLTR